MKPIKSLSDTNAALVVGAAYLIAVSLNQYVVVSLVGSLEKSREYIALHGVKVVFAATATHLIGVLLAGLLLRHSGDESLRDALRPLSTGKVVGTIVLVAVLSLLLNATGLWPFGWRWEYDSNVALVQALLARAHFLALLYWLLLYGVGVPFLEEVVFRFGLLQTLKRWTGSSFAAVTVSALIFGLLHLGYPPWSPDLEHKWNAIAVTIFALALGSLVLKQNGRISTAIMIHVTLNSVSEVMLVIAATRPGAG